MPKQILLALSVAVMLVISDVYAHETLVNFTHYYNPCNPGDSDQVCQDKARAVSIVTNYNQDATLKSNVQAWITNYYNAGVRLFRVGLWVGTLGSPNHPEGWGLISNPPLQRQLDNLKSYLIDIKQLAPLAKVAVAFAYFGNAWPPHAGTVDWNQLRETVRQIIQTIQASGVAMYGYDMFGEVNLDPSNPEFTPQSQVIDNIYPFVNQSGLVPQSQLIFNAGHGFWDDAVFHSGWFHDSNGYPRVAHTFRTNLNYLRTNGYVLPGIWDIHSYPETSTTSEVNNHKIEDLVAMGYDNLMDYIQTAEPSIFANSRFFIAEYCGSNPNANCSAEASGRGIFQSNIDFNGKLDYAGAWTMNDTFPSTSYVLAYSHSQHPITALPVPQNADFETAGDFGRPFAWTTAWNNSSNTDWSVTQEPLPFSGLWNLRIDNGSNLDFGVNGRAYDLYDFTIPVSANTNYLFKTWIRFTARASRSLNGKLEQADVVMTILYLDSQGNDVGVEDRFLSDGHWTYREFGHFSRSPSNAVSAKIRFGAGGHPNTIADFDLVH